MRSWWLTVSLVVAVVLSIGGCGFNSTRQTETYTVAVAGVVAETDSANYVLEGRPGSLHISFIASAAAGVGDLLLAGEGQSTWGYAARRIGSECWSIRADSRLDGAWIDANIGDAGGRPGVDIHIRVPKANDFKGGIDPNGQVLGIALCFDSAGTAISAE